MGHYDTAYATTRHSYLPNLIRPIILLTSTALSTMRLLLVIVSVAVAFASDLEPQAKLLASKSVENNFIVENRDLTLVYNIYNVGSSSALNVMLKDDTFPVTDFETVKGQLTVSWRSIPPNSNVTHIVVLKPLKSGVFNFTSAQLTYQPTEESESQVAFTSAPGEGGIMTEIEFSRKHSPHLNEWAMFCYHVHTIIVHPILVVVQESLQIF